MQTMQTLPIRLTPGQDLRQAACATAEVLLAEWECAREPDALTGYGELVVRDPRAFQTYRKLSRFVTS
ncbi:MAG: hypothetical protein JJD98_14300 [Polaromonas sp.]|nr:hypothetical protein [Polaromonas sp.]